MKRVLANSIQKVGDYAKKVAMESSNTSSAFLFYEPKAPKVIKERRVDK